MSSPLPDPPRAPRLGQAIAPGATVRFDPEDERLVLICPSLDAAPALDLRATDTPGETRLLLDGRDHARIRSNRPLAEADFVLIDQATAARMGLA